MSVLQSLLRLQQEIKIESELALNYGRLFEE